MWDFKDSNFILDEKYESRMPGVVSWNLIRLAFNVFVEKCGTVLFDSF